MRDIKIYVHGDVSIRMAWRYADRPVSAIPLSVWKIYGSKAIRTYYPEAELLVNGEVVLNELLDLLCIDILHLEMKVLIENGEQVS